MYEHFRNNHVAINTNFILLVLSLGFQSGAEQTIDYLQEIGKLELDEDSPS